MRKSCWLIILLMLASGCMREPSPRKEDVITILWAQWPLADALQRLSEGFTRETGIRVVVRQEPWGSFFDAFFRRVHGDSLQYDLVAGDSQWRGLGVREGLYTELTNWIKHNGVDRQMASAAMTGYAEYPIGSGRYWAVPLMGDALGFAYRKDLFESPEEKAAFAARYGYGLAVPNTWEQLRDIADFFNRPQSGLYGVTVWGRPVYDSIAMGAEAFIWAYGGDIGDQRSYHVKGILDTSASNRGLEMYKKIHDLGPGDTIPSYLEVNDAFKQGKVAMVMNFFSFLSELADPNSNPYAGTTGYFAFPAGPKARVTSLGGQGLSLVSASQKKEQSLRFLSWFVRKDVQQEWVRLGGFSCDRSVLGSPELLAAKPYHAALSESMQMMRDFWVVPEYVSLLDIAQKHWYRYLSSAQLTAGQVNAAIAKEWEQIFEMAGYYKE
ncbi:MAG: extracellular solute-binding protein [Candidatus Omnitrophica bacterium]|nr:extracellular solute-binding protein [Candidatus Omnitrophota bacterium]